MKIAYIFMFSVCALQLNAQNIEFTKESLKGKRELKQANKLIKKGDALISSKTAGINYINYQALDLYLEAYSKNPYSSSLNYKIAKCYSFTQEKPKALPYALKAKELNEDISEQIDFLLGDTYIASEELAYAIICFQNYIKKSSNKDSINIAKRRIENCKFAIKKLNEPPIYVIESISQNINTAYPEYCPLINSTDNTILFTSRRPQDRKGMERNDGFFEKLFISKNRDGWQVPEILPSKINLRKKFNIASICMSLDGRTVYLYTDRNNGDIEYCSYSNGVLGKPKLMPYPINTEYTESHISITADGKTAYIISNRPGGVGQKDIWTSTFDGKDWSTPVNLGNVVNTPYDEEGVFIHPNGKTLYFSSKGHNTMGGYDVFETELKDDGTWSKPQNMGYPVNSVDDDIFFVLATDGESAFFSSIRKNGVGLQDIYSITPFETIASKLSRYTTINGKVVDSETGKLIKAKVVIKDKETSDVVFNDGSDLESGFNISLPNKKSYVIYVEAEGYDPYEQEFVLESVEGTNEIDQAIQLFKTKIAETPKKEINIKIIFNDIFFEFDKYNLNENSKVELDKVIELVNSNPDIKIKIEGYTDNTGNVNYNINLSQKRADEVKQYFIKNGMNSSQILEVKGYGPKDPIASNTTKEGRQQNRRVEFKITHTPK